MNEITIEQIQSAIEQAEDAHHEAEKSLLGNDKDVARTMVVIVLGKTLNAMFLAHRAGQNHIVDMLQPNVNLYMRALSLVDKGELKGALQ